MSSSFYQILAISSRDMASRLVGLDNVSNNLANINTAGFKSNRVNFQELLLNFNGEEQRDGMRIANTQPLLGQGALRTTNNPLDVAIDGQGYFPVTLGDGRTGYTRDGQFQRDAAGNLATSGGQVLAWGQTIPAEVEEINIQPDGSVLFRTGEAWTPAGNIPLARFVNPEGLETYGENVWLETKVSGPVQIGAPGSPNFGSLIPKSIEASNVNMAEEVTQMINIQRNFQMSTRMFQQTDSMLNDAIHMRKA